MDGNLNAMTYNITYILAYICGLVGIAICVYKLIRIIKYKDIRADWLNGIWLSGLIAFLISFIGQLLYVADIYVAVSEATEPDINAIADGLSKAILYSLNGLIILTILLVFWGLLGGLITYKKARGVRVHKR